MVKASALAFAGISAPASPGQGIRRRSVSCMLSTRPLSLQKLPSCDAGRAEGTGAAPVNLVSTEPGLFLLRMDWLAVVQWGDKPADGSSRQISFQDQQWNHQRAWYVGRGDRHACAPQRPCGRNRALCVTLQTCSYSGIILPGMKRDSFAPMVKIFDHRGCR